MSARRSSYLLDKAIEAAVSAIEIYNKPGFLYREETFAILMLNAWELLLKSRILKENKHKLRSIEIWEPKIRGDGTQTKRLYPRKNRAGNTLSIGVARAAGLVSQYEKDGIDRACVENLRLLVEIRDNAIHFHNATDGLRKRVQEVGAAAVRNFAYATKSWFKKNLDSYNFALMPFAFESPTGIIQTVFADDAKGGARKLQDLMTELNRAFPFDANKPYNVGVELELRFVRRAEAGAIPVRLAPADPNAVPVMMNEEDVLKNYPWRYTDLTKALRKRYVNFKENEEFHGVRRPLEGEKRYCCIRQLDPKKKNSPKQKFYNPNIVVEFDKHYRLPE